MSKFVYLILKAMKKPTAIKNKAKKVVKVKKAMTKIKKAKTMNAGEKMEYNRIR